MPPPPPVLSLLVLLVAVDAVTAEAAAFRKCCPSNQQLSVDLRTCVPIRRGSHATKNRNYYATEPGGPPPPVPADPASRSRRGLEDWGWLPQDAVITDSDSLEEVTLDELRRTTRDASRSVEVGAGAPCSTHDTELLFWDDSVRLYSNGSMLVNQQRADLFRAPAMDGASGAGDEGERSFLFPGSAFCMDRLTLAPVVAVPLEDQDMDVEREVEDAVLEEEDAVRRDNETSTDAPEGVADDELGPDTHHVILLCPCVTGRCLRKCCHPHSVLVVDALGGTSCHTDPRAMQQAQPAQQDVASASEYNKHRTEQAVREWGPAQHRHPDYSDSGEELFLLHGLPQCSNLEDRRFLLNSVVLFNSSKASQFWVMPDGSAMVDSFGMDNPVPADKFCGEVAMDAVTGARAANLLVCADPGVLVTSRARILYGVLAATGAAFLAATLLVHACLPELRRSLHSSNLMAHTGSLLLAYIALTVNALATPELPQAACLILAFVLQFSFLAAFFWLNVMCVDISWAFSGLRLPQGSAAERDRKKFFWYSLYAWGGTACITLVTATINFLPDPESRLLHPQIGVVNCWFKEKAAVLLYFYGPMAFLLLANLVLFVYTAARILAVRKDTAILHKADNARTHTATETQRGRCWHCWLRTAVGYFQGEEDEEDDEEGAGRAGSGGQGCVGGSCFGAFATCIRCGACGACPAAGKLQECRLVLYVKLFCLMGLTWVTEIISWASGGRDYYWYATDAINLLRAVFIFIIFCCKRKVLRLVMDRLTGDEVSGGGGQGRSCVGPRGRRGAGTITSSLQTGSLTIHQDARRLQHTASQDSNVTASTTPSATPEAIVLGIR